MSFTKKNFLKAFGLALLLSLAGTPAVFADDSNCAEGDDTLGSLVGDVPASPAVQTFLGVEVPPNTDEGCKQRKAPAHQDGAMTYYGPNRLTDAAIKKYKIPGNDPGNVGASFITDGDGKVINTVNDLQFYHPATGKRGMELVITDESGATADYDQLVDALVRESKRMDPTFDPAKHAIFSPGAFVHFETNTGSVKDFATSLLGTENRATHETGFGKWPGTNAFTRNSPEGYHNLRLDNRGSAPNGHGYPVMFGVFKLEGVPLSVSNANGLIWMEILNNDVPFPGHEFGYKKDPFRKIDLATQLMYMRGWLDKDVYVKLGDKGAVEQVSKDTDGAMPLYHVLRRDGGALKDYFASINKPVPAGLDRDFLETWAEYCAEHINTSLNALANVPFNARGFQEVFGKDLGTKLHELGKVAFKKSSQKKLRAGGNPDADIDVPYFTPLWKSDKIKSDWNEATGEPGPNGIYANAETGALEGENKKLATTLGGSLIFKPSTVADLLVHFVENYASFPDVGGPTSTVIGYGFASEALDRLDVTPQKYFSLTTAGMGQVLLAEALSKGLPKPDGSGDIPFFATGAAGIPPTAAVAKYAEGLQKGLAAKLKAMPELAQAMGGDAGIDALTAKLVEPIQDNAQAIVDFQKERGAPACKEAAWAVMRKLVEDTIQAGREAGDDTVVRLGKAKYYAPPAYTTRMANNGANVQDRHPRVSYYLTAYAVDKAEAKTLPDSERDLNDDKPLVGYTPPGTAPAPEPDPVTPLPEPQPEPPVVVRPDPVVPPTEPDRPSRPGKGQGTD